MPSFNEICSDIKRRLSNQKLTNDTNLSDEHIYMLLKQATSRAIYAKIQAEVRQYGNLAFRTIDPSIRRELKLPIVWNAVVDPYEAADYTMGKVTIPVSILSAPLTNGLLSVHTLNPESGTVTVVRGTTYGEVYLSKWLPYITPAYIRNGQELTFYHLPHGVTEVIVVVLSSDIQTDTDGTPDLNAPWPAADDLLVQITQDVLAMLAPASFKPTDNVDDNKNLPTA